MLVLPGRLTCRLPICLILSKVIRTRTRSATISRLFRITQAATWRIQPHSILIRTPVNTKKMFITFVYFHRAEEHPRRHRLQQQQQRLRPLRQRRQQPPQRLQLLRLPDLHPRRGPSRQRDHALLRRRDRSAWIDRIVKAMTKANRRTPDHQAVNLHWPALRPDSDANPEASANAPASSNATATALTPPGGQ